jgi:hypothetical protein
MKKEIWDSSTKKAEYLTLADFGKVEEVKKMAKPARLAASRRGAIEALREIISKGILTNKSGLKVRISSKAIGKIVSNQAVNTSFCPEAHYLAAANLDYLFINSIEPWKFELNPTKNNDGLKDRHYLYAPMIYEYSVVFVKITVKEYINDQLENKLYSIEVISSQRKA